VFLPETWLGLRSSTICASHGSAQGTGSSAAFARGCRLIWRRRTSELPAAGFLRRRRAGLSAGRSGANRPAVNTEVAADASMWRSLVHRSRSPLLCGGQMHRIGRAYEEAGRCGKDQGAGSPQQSFRNWYELPQALLHMLVETGGQCAGVKGRQRSFAQAAMNYPVELGQCPHRRVDRVGCPHKFSNPRRFGFVEIELDDNTGCQDTRRSIGSRSSSTIPVLSASCGMRAQISRMESKIRAFMASGIRDGAVIGRSSATGSPRRSITIVPPSATSRTSSEV